MATCYAIGNGNASAGATWNTGNIPTVNDDVYTNNYTVTVDASVTWLSARNTAAAGITAGGKFLLTNGVTLTCTGTGVVCNSSVCIEMNLASPNIASVISTLVTNNIATNFNGGIILSGTGTLNITSNFTSNVGSNNSTINVTANGILNIVGNISFISVGNFIRITAATPVITVNGNLLTYSNSAYIPLIGNITASTTATINYTGILFGPNAGTGYGIYTTGVCNFNGTLTGGTATNACHGIYVGDGATVTVNGGAISSASIGSHAIYSTSVTSTILVSGTINNVNGYTAINTRKLALVNANTTQWLFQTDIVGTNKTLYSTDNVLFGYPAESDTRESIIFGQSGEFEGTLIVPSPASVAKNVPTDNTVGTMEMTPQDFWTYATRTLTSGGSGITAADVWDYLITNPIVPDSILELILTNLDAKVSSITCTTPAQIWDHLGNLISKNGSIGLSLKTFLSSQGKKPFILPVDKNYKG